MPEQKERKALKLVSRSARQWKAVHMKDEKPCPISFERDYSGVTTAADYADAWLRLGKAVAVMPDRESVCGTYFISDSGCNRIAVFKPVDEEWGQSGRPLSSEPFKGYAEAFLLGECAYKEAAAYLLDHNNNAGVPQTAIVKCVYPIPTCFGVSSGMGAFQVYQDNVGDADDYGPGIFSKENVQRIATFDLRVLNCDRHGGNLLVQETMDAKVRKLIPIDHGYILPDRVVTPPWPAWMQWPQVREPVHPSVKSYIQSVDFSHDLAMLEEELADKIHSGSLRTLRITTHLLKSAVDIGMSLYETGLLVYSSGTGKSKSVLEKVADEAYAAGLVREQRIESQLDLTALEHSSSAEGKLQPTTEDFIVRYASKLIDRHLEVLQGFGSCISRARSHPNFLRRPSDKPPKEVADIFIRLLTSSKWTTQGISCASAFLAIAQT